MILAGAGLSALGLWLWKAIGGYEGLLPGVFGLLGVSWVCIGILLLVRRKRLAITIDESGIEVPAFSLFRSRSQSVLITRQEIETIAKLETLKGRLIQITTRSGEQVLVQARNYCSLDEFLSHCRNHGLPVV